MPGTPWRIMNFFSQVETFILNPCNIFLVIYCPDIYIQYRYRNFLDCTDSTTPTYLSEHCQLQCRCHGQFPPSSIRSTFCLPSCSLRLEFGAFLSATCGPVSGTVSPQTYISWTLNWVNLNVNAPVQIGNNVHRVPCLCFVFFVSPNQEQKKLKNGKCTALIHQNSPACGIVNISPG